MFLLVPSIPPKCNVFISIVYFLMFYLSNQFSDSKLEFFEITTDDGYLNRKVRISNKEDS